jgi:peptide/nickel transport system permease protein
VIRPRPSVELIGFRRLIVTLPLGVVALSLLAFNLPLLAGIDPATATLRARYSDPNPDPAIVASLRGELGLDDHALVRFGRFLLRALQGDFGLSYTGRLPVGSSAWRAVSVSVQMVVVTVALASLVGVALGMVAAMRRGPLGRAASAISAAGASLPPHVMGPLCVLIFGIWLRFVPTGGWGSIRQMILPVVVLSAGRIASIAGVTRTEMLNALPQSFIRTARSKGLGPSGVTRHAFAVSRLGVLSIAATNLAGLLSGAVLVETIFSLPGLGNFIVTAVRNGDVPALQCGLFVVGSISLVVGSLADAAAGFADPRLRHAAR